MQKSAWGNVAMIFKRRPRRSILFSAILTLGTLAAACGQAAHAAGVEHAALPGSVRVDDGQMDTVHAAYLDLTKNISDVRARVEQWQKGDAASLDLANEKLERIDIVLASTPWPANLRGGIDLTHAFYGDWLSSLQGQHFSAMALHVIYLDLNANLNDLKARVALWEKGDESSVNIAIGKVERVEELTQHALGTGRLVKPLRAIVATLPSITAR
jgi:hypothetical protein